MLGGLLLENSLVRSPTRWEGASGARPTYDEITSALRSQVLRLIEHYFERVLSLIAVEFEDVPVLARDFNAQIENTGKLLDLEYPGLLEQADTVLRTGFDSEPPEPPIKALLARKVNERQKRDYAGILFGVREGIPELPDVETPDERHYPKRAAWLKGRLVDLGWSESDPSKWGGPDRKTVQKVLRGEAVSNHSLKKLAESLSQPAKAARVLPSQIPDE